SGMHRLPPLSPLFPYTTLFRSRFLPRQIALPPNHLDQRFMDVMRHRLLVAAHIEVRALLEPTIQVASLFEHAVLNVDFFGAVARSEEHTSELQSRGHLVCRLLL